MGSLAATLGGVQCVLAAVRGNAVAASEALEIAKRVNQIKRAHQTATPTDRKRHEAEAWALLNTLSSEQIEQGEGQAIALTLNSWAYFAKFWEHGQDGPLGPNDPLNEPLSPSA